MSNSSSQPETSKSTNSTRNYDPSILLSSLYGMNAYGNGNPVAAALAGIYGFSSIPSSSNGQTAPSSTSSTATTTTSESTTLGVAASQAASLGINQASAAWYAMAQQLAAQDYLARLNPAYAAAAIAAAQQYKGNSSVSPSTAEPLDTLRLPSDTEIIKYTAPSKGRGRKKTISLDPASAASAAAANMFLSNLNVLNAVNNGQSTPNSTGSSRGSTPTIPAGLTIEKKKSGGRKGGNLDCSASPIVDKVEITKVPIANGGNKSQDEAPLNLSLKTPTPSGSNPSNQTSSNKIPTDYYASQALSGAFLAEQIRQSQLAAALESRLESNASGSSLSSVPTSNLQNIQAALLMNKLKSGVTGQTKVYNKSTKPNKKSNLTVASLLSQHRNGNSNHASLEEVEEAEKSVSANPELTIEPIFKPIQQQSNNEWKEENENEDEDDRRYQKVMEDGKLKIKNISESPEIRNLSDQESDVESESGPEVSLKNNRCPSDLRLPLTMGWKRESLVREYSKSGFRGDVVYYAPCGKKFKQYTDILRYLEKRGNKDLQREHFSFSTKIYIGEFLKPTGQAENGEEKYLRLNEKEMIEDLETVRKENGWMKPVKKVASSDKKHKTKEEQQKVLLETLQQTQKESSDPLMHKEAMRLLKEAEKNELARKEREAKQLQNLEIKRKKQEEIMKQRQEENNRKLQEKEIKRQQAAILKEQERERRRQHLVFMKQLEGKKRFDERERRKEDMRIEKEKDRERRIEQKRLEYEIITELKRPCEDMTLTDDAKPLPEFDRMKGLALSGEAFANILMIHEFLHNFGETLGFDMDSLPCLSSLQAAMLNDVDSEEELLSVVIHLVVCAIEDPGIPTPQKHLTLLGQNLRQADITNTNISEILKIYLFARAQAEIRMCHGIIPPPEFFNPNHHKEKKTCDGAMSSDDYHAIISETKPYKMSNWIKDKPFLSLNPFEKSEIVSFLCNELLGNRAVMTQVDNNLDQIALARKKRWAAENKLKKLKMLQQRKFKMNHFMVSTPSTVNNGSTPTSLSSAPTAVMSTPPIAVTTPITSESLPTDTEAGAHSDKEEEDEASVTSVSAETAKEAPASTPPPLPPALTPKRKGRPPGSKKRKWGAGKTSVAAKKRKSRETPHEEEEKPKEEEETDLVKEEPEKKSDDEEEDDMDDDIGEEEEKMNQEELQKKIEKTIRLLNKRKDELIHTTNRFRGSDLGQDRYRRRYWHLAYVNGIFVEGIESAEPWKLKSQGMPSKEKLLKLQQQEEEDNESSSEEEEDEEGEEKENEKDNNLELKVEKDRNNETLDKKDDEDFEKRVLTKIGSEVSVISKVEEVKTEDDKSILKITPNGDKLNLFNHSAQFNMSLSPVVLNGSVTITPKQSDAAGSITNIPNITPAMNGERPWFSILPLSDPMLENPSIPTTSDESKSSSLMYGRPLPNFSCTSSPHIEMLESKLASIRKSDHTKERRPIPSDKTRGWWRITSAEVLRNVEYFLHPRGCREQSLLVNLKKCIEALVHHFDGSKNPMIIGNDMEFELSEYLKEKVADLLDKDEIPKPDIPGKWDRDVALRVDKYILEQVEALEDKVAAASMQVPGWKIPNRPDIDERKFRPSCIKRDEKEDLPDAIQEAKERLLDLEQNIERRYLKAPLGFGNNEPTLQTLTTCRTTLNSSKTPLEPENSEVSAGHGEDEAEESGDESNGKESGNVPEKEVLPRGLQTWREAVNKAKNAAQLAMGFYVLETSIAWHKSIMKAFCQLCHSGDNEDSLLLCDGCDKGYHTYCFKPSLEDIPDGDWYCFECINKATGVKHCLVCGKQEGKSLISCSSCPRAYHTECLSPALSKTPRGKWQCPGCSQRVTTSSKKKYIKRARFVLESPAQTDNEDSKDVSEHNVNAAGAPSHTEDNPDDDSSSSFTYKPPPIKKKKYTKADKDLTVCSTLLSELENSDEAWPFLYPVNTKQFPTYRKVIKNPMDIATIKRRLDAGIYKVRDDFCGDVRQIFANCEIFNEDDSPVGKAGHAMRTFFETRWAELTSITN